MAERRNIPSISRPEKHTRKANKSAGSNHKLIKQRSLTFSSSNLVRKGSRWCPSSPREHSHHLNFSVSAYNKHTVVRITSQHSPGLAEVDRGAETISVRAQSTENNLQLQRNTKHLVRKWRAVRRRHRRLTAWLHGRSQLLVIPGTETSYYRLAHIS